MMPPGPVHILITGGAGFVGRRLAQSLLAEGHRVTVLDTLSAQVHGPASAIPAELAGATFVRGDVRDTARLGKALSGVDAVAHLAAETGVGQSMYQVEHYVDVNDRGTACLLQAIVESRRPIRLVLASSRAVYGEGLYHCAHCGEVAPPARDPAALARGVWDPACPVCGGAVTPIATHEETRCRPASVYAATKLAQEQLCQTVSTAYGFPTVILRYFNVYGPGQSLSNPYTGILSTFHARAVAGKPIEIFEDGRESRDFVYIDDVVEATRRALLAPEDQVRSQVVNVGTGVSVSIAELARTMLEIGGWDVPVQISGAYRLGDVRHAFADTTRLRAVLGIEAVTSLEDGLRQWLQWAEDHHAHDSTDVASGELAARGLLRHAGNRGCPLPENPSPQPLSPRSGERGS
jgi:dTDP-L-rhamnose 4-epimerase